MQETVGADLDAVDVFLGPHLDSEIVFIVDQYIDGRWDEHKCVIGAHSEAQAKEVYLANYSDGWKCGPITAMTMAQFKDWLRNPAHTRTPLSQRDRVMEAAWVRYQGPRGGNGWRSSITGRVIYQDEMPKEREHEGESSEEKDEVELPGGLSAEDFKDGKDGRVQFADMREKTFFAVTFDGGKPVAKAMVERASRDSWEIGYSEVAEQKKGLGTEVYLAVLRRISPEWLQPDKYGQSEGAVALHDALKRRPDIETKKAGSIEMIRLREIKKPETAETKRRAEATRGAMSTATVTGKGKEKRVLLADGSEAPEHVRAKLGEISNTWRDVQVAVDPDSDVVATGINPRGKAVTVYRDEFHMKGHAIKAARVIEGLAKQHKLYLENQSNRGKAELVDVADATWLMQVQGTRPGSEEDTKGVAHLFGKHLERTDVIVTPAKTAKGQPKVELDVNGERVPIRDPGTRHELLRRLEHAEPLEDSTYWLKSHGATTLEGRHVVETQEGVRLRFCGKESVWHDHLIRDHDLAAMLLERKGKAGTHGKLFPVTDDKLRQYVASLDGGAFTSKDMRGIRANQVAISEIQRIGECCADEGQFKQMVKQVAEKVATILGNKPAQALASYILPEVFNGWKKGNPSA